MDLKVYKYALNHGFHPRYDFIIDGLTFHPWRNGVDVLHKTYPVCTWYWDGFLKVHNQSLADKSADILNALPDEQVCRRPRFRAVFGLTKIFDPARMVHHVSRIELRTCIVGVTIHKIPAYKTISADDLRLIQEAYNA